MDKLVTTPAERFWNPEAYERDRFIQQQAARLASGSWVLDAGAGASKYRPFFAHCRYQTQDFCQYQGELVRYLQPIDYVCDITAIPIRAGALDAILCTEVIEHVPDPMAVINEFARLLKTGGALLLTAPIISHLHMEPYHYYTGFTAQWYAHWLPILGFSIESQARIGGPGRACVVAAQAFYSQWAESEKKLSGWQYGLSRLGRAFAKIPAHMVLPRLLPRFDGWLGNHKVSGNTILLARRIEMPVSQLRK
jgi:SAM-dependent methyltransferase